MSYANPLYNHMRAGHDLGDRVDTASYFGDGGARGWLMRTYGLGYQAAKRCRTDAINELEARGLVRRVASARGNRNGRYVGHNRMTTYQTPDGVYRVRVKVLAYKDGTAREYLELTQYGIHVGDYTTVAELAEHLDLEQLEESTSG